MQSIRINTGVLWQFQNKMLKTMLNTVWYILNGTSNRDLEFCIHDKILKKCATILVNFTIQQSYISIEV